MSLPKNTLVLLAGHIARQASTGVALARCSSGKCCAVAQPHAIGHRAAAAAAALAHAFGDPAAPARRGRAPAAAARHRIAAAAAADPASCRTENRKIRRAPARARTAHDSQQRRRARPRARSNACCNPPTRHGNTSFAYPAPRLDNGAISGSVPCSVRTASMAEKVHNRVAEPRSRRRFCGYGKEILNFAPQWRGQKYRSQT